MIKYIKFALYTFVGVSIALLSINYIHSQMRKEYFTYQQLTSKLKHLNDTYYLCAGLLNSTPIDENIESCNKIYNIIDITLKNITRKDILIILLIKNK